VRLQQQREQLHSLGANAAAGPRAARNASARGHMVAAIGPQKLGQQHPPLALGNRIEARRMAPGAAWQLIHRASAGAGVVEK